MVHGTAKGNDHAGEPKNKKLKNQSGLINKTRKQDKRDINSTYCI